MPFKIISLKLYFASEKSCKCSFYLFLFPRLMKLIWNIYSLSNIQFQELRNNAACLFTMQTSILCFIASFVEVTCKTLIQIFHPFYFFSFFPKPSVCCASTFIWQLDSVAISPEVSDFFSRSILLIESSAHISLKKVYNMTLHEKRHLMQQKKKFKIFHILEKKHHIKKQWCCGSFSLSSFLIRTWCFLVTL